MFNDILILHMVIPNTRPVFLVVKFKQFEITRWNINVAIVKVYRLTYFSMPLNHICFKHLF